MTLFHFGNCFALAYLPHLLIYKCSGLSEYSAFWKCVQAGMAYLFTQLCKMLILATFFPATEVSATHLDIVGEIMKCTVDFGDLVGIYFIMNNIPGRGDMKFMITGLGWATAELLSTRFLPLWVGARGTEFDWKYIQMSFDSNINLIQHISTAILVWLWSRSDLNKSVRPAVLTLLCIVCYKPVIVEVLVFATGLGPWTLLLVKALFTICMGLVTIKFYIGLTQSPVNSHH
ncbi:BOS complex subunit TMEM147-like [Antedon mediterranea]|uniref:BOS complex subunit TMEM147-like n=1 Tax=Antedon mediterranea TaxID=105859 RepID=UPI003AF9E75E